MTSQRVRLTGPKMASQSQRSGWLVWSEPKNWEDSAMMTAMPTATGSQAFNQNLRLFRLDRSSNLYGLSYLVTGGLFSLKKPPSAGITNDCNWKKAYSTW